jgi:hypothetical protein
VLPEPCWPGAIRHVGVRIIRARRRRRCRGYGDGLLRRCSDWSAREPVAGPSRLLLGLGAASTSAMRKLIGPGAVCHRCALSAQTGGAGTHGEMPVVPSKAGSPASVLRERRRLIVAASRSQRVRHRSPPGAPADVGCADRVGRPARERTGVDRRVPVQLGFDRREQRRQTVALDESQRAISSATSRVS